MHEPDAMVSRVNDPNTRLANVHVPDTRMVSVPDPDIRVVLGDLPVPTAWQKSGSMVITAW